jgi:hypothetical protein
VLLVIVRDIRYFDGHFVRTRARHLFISHVGASTRPKAERGRTFGQVERAVVCAGTRLVLLLFSMSVICAGLLAEGGLGGTRMLGIL